MPVRWTHGASKEEFRVKRLRAPDFSGTQWSARHQLWSARVEFFLNEHPSAIQRGSCGELNTHRIHLDQSSFDWTCKKCGHLHPSFLSLDFTIGPKLLQRSLFELKVEKDYSMSIVFSATALDSELSRLFFKWKSIANGLAGLTFDEEACKKKLLKFHNFINKMTGVTEMLHPGGGIEAFVGASAEFTDALKLFPSLNHGSLAADFHKTVLAP